MPEKKILYLLAILAILGAAFVMLISWRLRRIATVTSEAEQRQAAAFEEMSRVTKELHERGKTGGEFNPSLPPGERLQHMYPGVKRPSDGPEPS